MGRASTSSKEAFNRVAWTPPEDKRLMDYISMHGPGKWERLAKELGNNTSHLPLIHNWKKHFSMNLYDMQV